MLSSVHVLHENIADVKETIINIGAGSGLIPVEDAPQPKAMSGWTVGIFKWTPRWISVVDSANNPRGMASSLAAGLRTLAIGIMVDDPLAWCFTVFKETEQVAHYKWSLPVEMLSKSDDKVRIRETERLRELGVQDLSILEKRISKQPERVVSSDPRVEVTYRRKILDGDLDLPAPRFNPALPVILHKATGMSTPARLRKILSAIRMNVIEAVSEFNTALNLPDWLSPDDLDSPQYHRNTADAIHLRLMDPGDH
ncbi:MAG TPA: hypothetical protein PLV45_17445 [bacterium]|nr:hypothetical protein [bacterium]